MLPVPRSADRRCGNVVTVFVLDRPPTRQWLLGLCLSLAATAPAWLPWLGPQITLWNNAPVIDDAKTHILRLWMLEWIILRGAWYPRWLPELFLGYGYPVFNFYAPGFYAVAFAHKLLLRLDTWDAYRAVGVTGIFIGAAGVYALVVSVWRRVVLGVFAAVCLIYFPYAFQLNLFKRGDLPELLALALVPWLLYTLWRLWCAEGRAVVRWVFAAAAVGASIVLTHNLTLISAAFIAAPWTAGLATFGSTRRGLQRIALAGTLALGVTTFFWLPVVAEANAVQLDWLHADTFNYRTWFVRADGGSFREGYRENRQTRYGVIDTNLHYPHQLLAPPKVSLGQAGVVVLASGALAGSLGAALLGRRRPLRSASHGQLPDAPVSSSRAAILAATLVATAAMSWYLTLWVSEPVWELVPLLPLFQFPWRWMGPLALCLAAGAAGALAAPLALLRRRVGRAAWAGDALVYLAAAAVMFNSLGAREFSLLDPPEQPDRAVDGRRMRIDERDDWGSLGTTSGREFLPHGVQLVTYTRGAPRGAQVFESLYPELDWSGGLLYPMGGDLRFLAWRASPVWISARVANDSAVPARLGVHQARFLGWRAWIDGQATEIGLSPYIAEQQANPGFMVLTIPPGEHTVSLAFGPTPPRLAGVVITLLTLLVAVAVVGYTTGWVGAWRSGNLSLSSGAAGGALAVLIVILVAVVAWRTVSPSIHRFAQRPPVLPVANGAVLHLPSLRARETAMLVNVAEAVRSGHARVASPGGGRSGADPFVDVRYQTITDTDAPLRGAAGTSRRQWLYLHPPAAVSVDVQLPPGRQVWFQTALALNPEATMAETGDGVRFQVLAGTVDASGAESGQVLVLDEEVNPRARAGDRRWLPVAADLSEWAGRTVRIRLQTHPRDDLTYDWAGWANPVIFVRESARGEPFSLRSTLR